MCPDIIKEQFEIDNRNDNFRYNFSIKQYNVWLVYCGSKIASFIDPKIWDTLPDNCLLVNNYLLVNGK